MIACSQRHQGGQDGGGGQTALSTPEQVRKTIEQAQTLVTDPRPSRNIVLRFFFNMADDDSLDAQRLYPALPKKSHIDLVTAAQNGTLPPQTFKSPVLDVLRTKKLRLLERGDCEQSSRPHADASVSRYDLDGIVCFSVGNLTHVAPEALLQEILALFVHEAVHLGGAKTEAEAEAWQNKFAQFYRERFASIGNENVYYRTSMLIFAAKDLLQAAQELQKHSPNDPRINGWMGQFFQNIYNLPYYNDPMLLNLAVSPQKPELVDNYALSAIALAATGYQMYGAAEDYQQNPTQFRNSHLPSDPKKMAAQLGKISKIFLTMSGNFEAYYEGEGVSKCLLPTQTSDASEAQMFSLTTPLQSMPPDDQPLRCD
jgi:hypothetical protein